MAAKWRERVWPPTWHVACRRLKTSSAVLVQRTQQLLVISARCRSIKMDRIWIRIVNAVIILRVTWSCILPAGFTDSHSRRQQASQYTGRDRACGHVARCRRWLLASDSFSPSPLLRRFAPLCPRTVVMEKKWQAGGWMKYIASAHTTMPPRQSSTMTCVHLLLNTSRHIIHCQQQQQQPGYRQRTQRTWMQPMKKWTALLAVHSPTSNYQRSFIYTVSQKDTWCLIITLAIWWADFEQSFIGEF